MWPIPAHFRVSLSKPAFLTHTATREGDEQRVYSATKLCRCSATQRTVNVEVVRDLLHAHGVVFVGHQHALARGICSPALAAADVPHVAQHELEVVVVIDAGAARAQGNFGLTAFQ